MQLQRVILYQNGIGYFERTGHLAGETLQLSFARGELDDVLKTLTVIDRLGAGVATVDVPTPKEKDTTIGLGVRMSAGRVHDLKVSYAVPTPTWKAAYRVVLDDKSADKSLIQGWAMVNNVSQEDWRDVQLTLATGAPMSFVHDLHTPEYVKRPDIHGNLIAPTITGPIAIFSRGTFVGDSMVGRLNVGETAWIPYALDGATSITQTADEDERPIKIVSIQRGVLTVENAGVRVTHYSIAAGADPTKVIYLRHAKAYGFTAKDLPPGTLDRGDSYLIPLPLQAGKTSVLAVEERQPRRHTLQILDAGATEIGLYVEGSHLPPEVAHKLTEAIALRKDMGTLEEELESLRTRLVDLAERGDQIRENLAAIEKVRTGDALRKKLVASLTQVTSEADTIAKKLGEQSETLATARNKLQESLRDITLAEKA